MIWNTIPNEEKLRLWKKLRTDINDLSLTEKLEEIAKFCSRIPYGSRTIDYYTPSEWPSPWEILFYGSFCTSSISLLMYYTLILTTHDVNVELWLVEDQDGMFLLPIIENQFVLNYELGKISKIADIKEYITVKQVYTQDQIKNIR